MNRILATILATLNALLGFVLIFGSIWFAKFMYEQIATQQVAADMVSQAQIIRSKASLLPAEQSQRAF